MGNDATIQLFRILGGFLRMSFVGTLSRDTSHQRLDFGTLSSWWFEFAHFKKNIRHLGSFPQVKGENKHFFETKLFWIRTG